MDNLAATIKKNPGINPFSRLKEKLKGSKLKFTLKTVTEQTVLKVLKSLKSKTSCGYDGITS